MACSSATSGGGADAAADASPQEASAGDAGAGSEAGDAGEGGGSDAARDAGGCTTLANTAQVVQEQDVAGPAPTAAGGVIADGTYFLTAARVFTGDGGAAGPTGAVYQVTLKTSAGVYEDVQSSTGAAVANGEYSGTYAVSGPELTIHLTCGAVTTLAYPFDSDGKTTFTLYQALSGGSTSALTVTKQ